MEQIKHTTLSLQDIADHYEHLDIGSLSVNKSKEASEDMVFRFIVTFFKHYEGEQNDSK